MRIIQIKHPRLGRKIALVKEPNLILINQFESVFSLAQAALQSKTSLTNCVKENLSDETIGYDDIYSGKSAWKILPAIDHPFGNEHCMVSGTGLTHKASAENRQKMHQAQAENQLSDSMKIYQWGEEGGKPASGQIGTQPEWFYKGNGSILKAHNEPLLLPNYGNDGGEEPEIAGIYINDQEGNPHRIGFATGNEFSDHVMEKKNYLYLAPSKIRTCSIGPELVITDSFSDISGEVSIERNGEILWRKSVKTGEENMAHSLQNLEFHHFKYDNHRQPNSIHVHFFGTGAFSFGENIRLEEGDLMMVNWQNMGRALTNFLKIDGSQKKMFTINSI
jgi:hypothetical protein